MRWFLRVWSFVSSPLLIPLLVSVWFLSYTSGGLGDSTILPKLYIIATLTVGIPLVFYFLLYYFKLANSIELSTTRERLVPLVIYGILIIAILKLVFYDGQFLPLYYFFIGILMSTIISLIMALFQFKISLHMMAISGTAAFVMILSFYLQVELIYQLIVLSVAIGLTATSRLSMKAHSPIELIFGTVLGIAVQVMAATFYV